LGKEKNKGYEIPAAGAYILPYIYILTDNNYTVIIMTDEEKRLQELCAKAEKMGLFEKAKAMHEKMHKRSE